MKHLRSNYNETQGIGPLFDSVNKTPKSDTEAQGIGRAAYDLVMDACELEKKRCLSRSQPSTTGKQLKEKGMELVRENNENWMRLALAAAKIWVEARAHWQWDFTAEEIRFEIRQGLGEPKHPNAYGALINTLIKRKIIVPTGEHRQMKDRSSHARSTPVYKAG